MRCGTCTYIHDLTRGAKNNPTYAGWQAAIASRRVRAAGACQPSPPCLRPPLHPVVSGTSAQLRVYAHCLPSLNGSVAVAYINIDPNLSFR